MFRTIQSAVCWGCCALVGMSSLVADEKAPTPVAPVPPNVAFGPDRVLLLNNGKIVKGNIQQSAQGYIVTLPAGRMVLGFDQVRFEADDVEDAYRQQRRDLPKDSADGHIDLARWCVTNGLPDQARVELRSALKLDPTSRTAQNMLQRITDIQLKTKDLPEIAARKNGQYSLVGSSHPTSNVDTFGGLPREAALEFMSKIQPMLTNRCATAGCHGPDSGNSFVLQRVKAGKITPKSYSEKNLTAILERVDPEQPLSSPLLAKLRGETKVGIRLNHGGLSQDNLQSLRRWVESLAPPAAKPTANPTFVFEPEPEEVDPAEKPAVKTNKPTPADAPTRSPAKRPSEEPDAAIRDGQTEPT